jgi:hypothetical protein
VSRSSVPGPRALSIPASSCHRDSAAAAAFKVGSELTVACVSDGAAACSRVLGGARCFNGDAYTCMYSRTQVLTHWHLQVELRASSSWPLATAVSGRSESGGGKIRRNLNRGFRRVCRGLWGETMRQIQPRVPK